MTIVAEQTRVVDVAAVANALAHEDIAAGLRRVVGLDERARDELAEAIMSSAASDTLGDDETEVMQRAVLHHLRATFGDRVSVCGYIDGEQIRAGGRSYCLTGEVCEECGVAALAYGPGGGEVCVDESGCGWRFCW